MSCGQINRHDTAESPIDLLKWAARFRQHATHFWRAHPSADDNCDLAISSRRIMPLSKGILEAFRMQDF
jgi:hypothetical protein